MEALRDAAHGVPWWGRVSSALAPVLLVGGWTVAARLQPDGFDSVQGTISALASYGASERWVMTVAIAGTGVCHLVTAAALRPAAPAGRRVLALGGAATIAVAAFPLPAAGGSSAAHTAAAVTSFVLLSAWAPSARRQGAAAWGLRPRVAIGAGAVLGGLTLAFFAAALADAGTVGLVERLAAGAQALWPAVVVASVPRGPGPAP
jgi:hypothetical membrane protein